MEDKPKNYYSIDYKDILGKGSFGIVYKGISHKDDKEEPVALKQIPKEIANDRNKLQLLSNEVVISANLFDDEDKNEDGKSRMKNIVSFLDIIKIDNNGYLVYEFCNGGDLRRYLRFFKTFDETAVQYFMKQVLNGLSELHDKKIIHHDIKPENVLVELIPYDIKDKNNVEERKKYEKTVDEILQLTDKKKNQNPNLLGNQNNMNNTNKDFVLKTLLRSKIKVSDFGLSKFKEDNNQKMLSGSPLYMDPTLFEPNVDIKTIESEKVDIWAVGIFAYELFFGRRPFNSPSQSLKELIQVLKKGLYVVDLKECKKISKQFLSFLNMCLQRSQQIRPNVTDLQFSEFITREPNNFEYINIMNLSEINIPSPNYVSQGQIIMSIDDNRSMNASFDF